MDSWIAELHYIFWGFSSVRLAKKGYYCMYNVLIVQHSSGKGDLGDNSWQTIWQDFHMKIFLLLTFSFPFEIFHGVNFLTNSGCKMYFNEFVQVFYFLSQSQREKWLELSKLTMMNETLGLIRTWINAEFSQHKLFYFKHWLFCTNIFFKQSNS